MLLLLLFTPCLLNIQSSPYVCMYVCMYVCLLKSCRGAPRRADWEAWSKAECVFRASPCLARTFRANNLGNLVAAIAADPMGDAAMHRTLDRTPSCLRASLV